MTIGWCLREAAELPVPALPGWDTAFRIGRGSGTRGFISPDPEEILEVTAGSVYGEAAFVVFDVTVVVTIGICCNPFEK
jgi:hypothetical protein